MWNPLNISAASPSIRVMAAACSAMMRARRSGSVRAATNSGSGRDATSWYDGHGDSGLMVAVKPCSTPMGRDATCVAQAWQRQTERTGHFDPQAWPHLPDDFRLRPWPRTDAFPTCPQQLGLYAVLPDAAWVGRMARAGVPTVQLRFKSDDPSAIRREVEASAGTSTSPPHSVRTGKFQARRSAERKGAGRLAAARHYTSQ